MCVCSLSHCTPFFPYATQPLVPLYITPAISFSHLQRELAGRPTVVPVTVHSLVTTLCAAAVIWPPGRPTLARQPLGIWFWRRAVLPFSSAYWVFDLYYYCYQVNSPTPPFHHMWRPHFSHMSEITFSF